MSRQRYHYEWVMPERVKDARATIVELINLVQKDLKGKVAFVSTFYIGSSGRKMVTEDPTTNIPFDIDCNIIVDTSSNRTYPAKKTWMAIMNSINKFTSRFGFGSCKERTRVLTIKKKDSTPWKDKFSCDFAIVHNYVKNGEKEKESIHHLKSSNTYGWYDQPQEFRHLSEREQYCKKRGLWNVVRNEYLRLKNEVYGPTKSSREIYAEAVNNVYTSN